LVRPHHFLYIAAPTLRGRLLHQLKLRAIPALERALERAARLQRARPSLPDRR
jgi:hypothetical protein